MTTQNDSKINDLIKFEINDFVHKCLDLHKQNIDNSVKSSYDDLKAKIVDGVKSNVMQTIGTNDLYKYDTGFYPNDTVDNVLKDLQLVNEHGVAITNKQQYVKSFITNEKLMVYIKYNMSKQHDHGDRKGTGHIFVTNYARVLMIIDHNVPIVPVPTPDPNAAPIIPPTLPAIYILRESNFWIPTDYIRLIKNLLHVPASDFVFPTLYDYRIDNISTAMIMIREQLYDRKIVPLYTRDLVEENEKLVAKYAQYEADKLQLEKEREELDSKRKVFNDFILPYTNVECEKEALLSREKDLAIERERLRRIAQKIALEREEFKRERELIESINLNDI